VNALLDLVASLGGVAIVTGAAAWLLRSIVTHWLSKDIEAYKTNLALESERQIEEFKTQLGILAKEQDVRFTKLHEKRAEVIASLYSLIEEANITVALFQRLLKLRQNGRVADDRVKDYAEKSKNATRSLFDFARKNQLYFTKELADTIQSLSSRIAEPVWAFVLKPSNPSEDPLPEYDEIIEIWTRGKEDIRHANRHNRTCRHRDP